MSTITNQNGKLVSCDGRDAVEALRLRTIISGIKLEEKGIRVNRSVNCTKLGKEITGLKTRDRSKIIEALEKKLNEQIAKCDVVTLPTTH